MKKEAPPKKEIVGSLQEKFSNIKGMLQALIWSKKT
jgi:hypothetical protein